MLTDFIMRFLLMILGYMYPAFQCFKTVEKNKVEIDELRFWCQYWIIMAMMAFLERITDVLVSWFPFYGEMKLAFVIYLWYPRTKGTTYVYDGLLRPVIASHETEIDRKLMEMRARAWDFTLCYWQNCAEFGQAAFFQLLQSAASQSGRFTQGGNKDKTQKNSPPPSAAGDASINRAMFETSRANVGKVDSESYSRSEEFSNAEDEKAEGASRLRQRRPA